MSTGDVAAEAQPSLEDLKLLIAQLQQQQENSQQALAAITQNKLSSSTAPQVISKVVVPRDRKVKNFSGSDSDSWPNVEDFIEEIEGIFKAREMTNDVALDFILSHLENPARDEIKLYQKSDRNTAEKLFKILREAFGEKRSLPQLLKKFYDRQQQDEESIMQFSHALREYFGRVTAKCPSAANDSDKTLRDTFVDNLRDSLLRKELKRFIRCTPHTTFLDIREEAIRWSEDDPETADHNAVVDKIKAHAPHKQPSDSASTPSDLTTIMQALTKQQEQINELTKAMHSMTTSSTSAQFSQQFQRKPRRPLICYNCQAPGHISRNCVHPPSRPQSSGYNLLQPPSAMYQPSPQVTQHNGLIPPASKPTTPQFLAPQPRNPNFQQAPNPNPLSPGAMSQGGNHMARK